MGRRQSSGRGNYGGQGNYNRGGQDGRQGGGDWSRGMCKYLYSCFTSMYINCYALAFSLKQDVKCLDHHKANRLGVEGAEVVEVLNGIAVRIIIQNEML